MEQYWLIDGEIFIHPFTCLIAGPTQSGKTTFIKDIIVFNKILIKPSPQKIIYCYRKWQPMYDQLKNSIEYLEFCENIYNIDLIDSSTNTLIIFDDLMNECENDKSILELFTVDSHHKNISVFFLSQNLFSQGKYSRTISLNCNYITIFKNPRDKSQIYVLAKQMYPDKFRFFLEAFNDAINSGGHTYLFLDLKQKSQERNRVQTGILPGSLRIIYTPK